MIATIALSRAGGFVILLLLGREFPASTLGDYFTALAVIGVCTSIAQAGCGAFLVRLAQSRRFKAAFILTGLRLLIAIAAITVIAPHLPSHTWPVLLMPVAAAMSPDWLISADLRFYRLTLIAATAQLVGIIIAAMAVSHHSPLWLVWCAPGVSMASCLASICFALTTIHIAPAKQTSDRTKIDLRPCLQLICFTLLAGLIPNFDVSLLAPKLSGQAHDALMLVHRLLLLSSALMAAIFSVLFAQRRTDRWREIWLFIPPLLIALPILMFPDFVISLIYRDTSIPDISLLMRLIVPWMIVMALILRQILVVQERANGLPLAISMLGAFLVSGFILSQLHVTTASAAILAICLKLGLLCGILFVLSGSRYKQKHNQAPSPAGQTP